MATTTASELNQIPKSCCSVRPGFVQALNDLYIAKAYISDTIVKEADVP